MLNSHFGTVRSIVCPYCNRFIGDLTFEERTQHRINCEMIDSIRTKRKGWLD